MRLTVNASNASEIFLTQTHIAATMRKDQQIIVADHRQLKNLFHHDKLCRYDIFGLKMHGNFTASKIVAPRWVTADRFEDVSYVQASYYYYIFFDFYDVYMFISLRINTFRLKNITSFTIVRLTFLRFLDSIYYFAIFKKYC